MNVIYRKKNYNIYRVGNGYIVHNTNKPFKIGHTHISNYNTAKTILNFSFHKSIPNHLNKYPITEYNKNKYRQRIYKQYKTSFLYKFITYIYSYNKYRKRPETISVISIYITYNIRNRKPKKRRKYYDITGRAFCKYRTDKKYDCR